MATVPISPSAFLLSSSNNLKRRKPYVSICQSTTTKGSLSISAIAPSRRDVAIGLVGGSVALVGYPAFGLLEADDDEELLEKVKADKKKRIENRDRTNQLKSETAYVQDAVYKLSEVGQAIDKNDFTSAKRVLGASLDTKWIVNVEEAFSKVSSNPEEKIKADTFTTSLASLISAVSKENLDLCKSAFVTCADALEDWSAMTGLSEQLKGL